MKNTPIHQTTTSKDIDFTHKISDRTEKNWFPLVPTYYFFFFIQYLRIQFLTEYKYSLQNLV